MTDQILYIDLPGFKPLPDRSVLKVISEGAEVVGVTDPTSAVAAVAASDNLKVVVCNTPSSDIYQKIRAHSPDIHTVLVTEKPMDQYSVALAGKEDTLVDHVVASRSPSPWTVHELRVTIQKVLRGDIFGLEKYFAPGTPVQSLTVTGSADRERYNAVVMKYAEENRLGQYMAKLAFGISEELLMNAIYDAPIAGGHHHYGDLPRTTAVTLNPDEYATLTYGCDGVVFGIAVADPFGALTREKLFQYLKKVLRRSDSTDLIDTKKGGAGLGLFKILYSSHSLVCNVKPKETTEVMALIDIKHQVRDFSKMARSVHYFQS